MLFLDTSALVKRYVAEPESELVIELMAADSVWGGVRFGPAGDPGYVVPSWIWRGR
jgi:hypothetical protein